MHQWQSENACSDRNVPSRREFVKTSATAAATTMLGASAMALPVHAAGGADKLKVAIVGCGRRGNGALTQCLDAGQHLNLELKVVATADYFEEKALETGKKHGVDPENCFGGANGYKEVMKSDADVVLLTAPPAFRPPHFEAAVDAGKHVFMEKPVAVDPPGVRKMFEIGKQADEKGVVVVAGTHTRHNGVYRQQAHVIHEGGIGKIVGGAVYYCIGRLWYKERLPGESDADYLVRNWTSFVGMSGDHIVEQHVHNIDIANWFIGRTPRAALGFGSRIQRKTGDQFDFFSVDFDYGEGCRIHSMCRQITGCTKRNAETFSGTEGQFFGSQLQNAMVRRFDGREITGPEFETYQGPHTHEHVDLLNSIVRGEKRNETQAVTESTLSAIMGRMSAYTGQLITWEDLTTNTASDWYAFQVTPQATDFEEGNVVAPEDDVYPRPGE